MTTSEPHDPRSPRPSPPPRFGWRGETTAESGVRERDFAIEVDGESIPGVLWSPDRAPEDASASGPLPLVLLGHGGRSNKRANSMQTIGRRLARREGLIAASIDQIEHGDRGPQMTPDNLELYAAMWRHPGLVETSTRQWRAVAAALAALPEVDAERVGYWGLSMGTMFGMPFVAEEPLIRAAVLGLASLTGPSVDRSGIDAVFREAAPRVACPVMWVVQWDDQQFDREGSFALFDLLGTANKRLIAFPGRHGEAPDESTALTREFLARELSR